VGTVPGYVPAAADIVAEGGEELELLIRFERFMGSSRWVYLVLVLVVLLLPSSLFP